MNIPKPVMDGLAKGVELGILEFASALARGDRKAAEVASVKAIGLQFSKASTVAAKKAKGR